ncbi:unnamed protein product [Protopolystoma xenopodis]|uniref:Uncharacterized protein n=1 Tax=Protopolystoma xenopodis TaxID=117903 RepID=A0A448WUU9_9PLAT|nr:unnamed protein product [Protopolystoma xenopodis]
MLPPDGEVILLDPGHLAPVVSSGPPTPPRSLSFFPVQLVAIGEQTRLLLTFSTPPGYRSPAIVLGSSSPSLSSSSSPSSPSISTSTNSTSDASRLEEVRRQQVPDELILLVVVRTQIEVRKVAKEFTLLTNSPIL